MDYTKMPDFSNFLDVQTKTPWARTLADFASFCDPRPDSVVLDIGCGPGMLPLLFIRADCHAFGVDLDFALLASRLTNNPTNADAYHLPFPSATFNLITATNILFLLEQPLPALNEWKRVLHPNGMLCLLNPSERMSILAVEKMSDERNLTGTVRESLLNWARNAEAHIRWTEEETRTIVSMAGFQMPESVLKVGPGFARYSRAIPLKSVLSTSITAIETGMHNCRSSRE
jgi:ubiquinone/menaquinone biosynthesis C-methylase UbiE